MFAALLAYSSTSLRELFHFKGSLKRRLVLSRQGDPSDGSTEFRETNIRTKSLIDLYFLNHNHTVLMECPFNNYHHAKLWGHQLGLDHNSSAVPLLFGLLWPEDDLSLLVPLGAKLCFCSLWSCMEYSAQPRNTST